MIYFKYWTNRFCAVGFFWNSAHFRFCVVEYAEKGPRDLRVCQKAHATEKVTFSLPRSEGCGPEPRSQMRSGRFRVGVVRGGPGHRKLRSTRVRSCFQPRSENSAKTTTRGSRGRLVVCRRGPSARRGAAHGWGVAGGGGGRRRARVRRTHARRRAANSWEVKGPRISETIRCPGSGACWDSPSAERDS